MGCCVVSREDPYMFIKTKTVKIDYSPLSFVKASEMNQNREHVDSYSITTIGKKESTNTFRELREVTVKEQKEENLLDVNLEQKADNKNTISANYSLEPNKEYKTLTLSVIEAKNLEIGAVITVTPFGVNNKKIMSGQGMVFGKEYPNNAFNFPNEENVGIKQFEINYDFTNQNYFIKDYQKGTGIFIKIDRKHLLDQEYILSFCNTHILIYKISRADHVLKFKFLQGLFKDKVFTFNPADNPVVRIGRNRDLEVVYCDESISRQQCTFIFDKRWHVYDGSQEKPSTNGIWILASKSIEISNNMILKSGNTTFRATVS